MRPVDCTDTDSDDDLVPYALDDDPDSTQPDPPRYLRTLMQGVWVMGLYVGGWGNYICRSGERRYVNGMVLSRVDRYFSMGRREIVERKQAVCVCVNVGG